MRRVFLLILSITLLTACTPTPGVPDEAEVATIVAATLDASAASADSPMDASPPADSPAEAPLSAPLLIIAYTIDGNLWTVAGESPPVQRTTGGGIISVRLSDDGARVVYARSPESGETSLHVYNLDANVDQTLLDNPTLNALYPPEAGAYLRIDSTNLMFVPDAHDFFFSTRVEFEGPGGRPNNDLYRIQLDTGAIIPVFGKDEGGNIYLSPDGNAMAITTPTMLRYAAVDGTPLGASRLTYDPVMTYSEFAYYPDAVWSSDGQAVYAVIPSSDPMAPDASATIWRIPLADLPPESIHVFSGGLFMLDAFGSTWIDPTGSQIAVFQSVGTGSERSLSIAPLAGGSETFIAEGVLEWEGWSPRGGFFSYSTQGPDAALILASTGGVLETIPAGRWLIWVGDDALVLAGERGSWSLIHRSTGGTMRLAAVVPSDWTAFDAVLTD